MNNEEIICYVDDEFINCELFKRNFSRYYRVEVFTEPDEAIKYLASCEVSLLITDYKMPLMTGMDLVREAISVCPGLPCIILSGFQKSEVDVDESMLSGYIMKPYRRADLVQKINEALLSASSA